MNLALEIGQERMEFLEISYVYSSHGPMPDCDALDKTGIYLLR